MPPIPAKKSVTYGDPKHAPAIKTDDSIELSFRNEVMAGTGDIILSNGSDTRRIAINDTSQITFSSSKLTGNSVIINPAQDLIPNTHYSIRMDSGVIQDFAGNINTGIDDPETLSFNTTDSAPLFLYSNIENNPWGSDLPAELPADEDIWLHFDEQMIPGSGSIILSNGPDTRTIDITDASQVIFDSFGGVTINPAADLIPNTHYHIQIPAGTITDTTGNTYAGNGDSNALGFTTGSADPAIWWSYLSSESTLKVDSGITFYFNQAIKAGSGYIVISNGSDTRAIDITDTSQVTFTNIFSGAVTVKPAADLIPGTAYTVQMTAGVITDDTGHAFDGIETNTMHFTTIASNPSLDGINWVNLYAPMEEITIKADDAITLQFDEKVLPGNGEIVISNGIDTRAIDIHDNSQVTFDDYGQMFVKPSQDWLLGTHYTIRMATGVVMDSDGNAFTGSDDLSGLSFTPVESNPVLSGTNFMASDGQPFLPVSFLWSEQLQLSPDSGIQLLFDEPVMAGNGKITISSDTDTRIIDIHDTNQVKFHEYGDMIISPVEDLLPHTLYHIEIANGVVTDSAGNPYEGIHDTTTLDFTTTDPYFITMTGVGSPDIMVS
ncbi:Ig-like domain-containing protein [Nitrosomonas oligotropha]|uniref:Ig-like domain-containing protein n=1 Tax=Nitrosomonas oligotropha TaxID=42354 RepID=UPI001369C2BB|nr:Ig-like domain-containing protein [Nitrosomonas oligotropha]